MEDLLKRSKLYYEYATPEGQIWRFMDRDPRRTKLGFDAFVSTLDRFGNRYFRYEFAVRELPGNCKVVHT